MGIIVQKFGGSSVADNERLLNVCKHIINEYNKNNKVVVVVSAQGKTTDKLVSEESEISKSIDLLYDMLPKRFVVTSMLYPSVSIAKDGRLSNVITIINNNDIIFFFISNHL